MFYILDADHRVIEEPDMMRWSKWMEGASRKVARTILDGSYVSTVFLGIDHRFVGNGPPVVFETMVFGGPLDQKQARYSSWDDALTGHMAIVRRLRPAK